MKNKEENKIKSCPFKAEKQCNDTCALYIHPDELNESFGNKLKSIGVMDSFGMCSLKNIALSEARKIYETSGKLR